MVVKHCSWGKCNSDSRYKDRPEMEDVYFLKFPSKHTDRESCRKWVKACGRANFALENVSRAHFICSKHFIGGKGPTSDYPDPVPCSASNTEMAIFSARKKRPPPKTRDRVDQSGDARASTEIYNGAKVKLEFRDIDMEHSYCIKEEEMSTETIPDEDIPVDKEIEFPSVEVKERPMKVDMATQTNLCYDDLSPYEDEDIKGRNLLRKLFKDKMLEDDKSTKFYTGLNYASLMVLFNFLKLKAQKMKYWQGSANTVDTDYGGAKKGQSRKLTTLDEFYIVLIRLRRGFEVEVIADIFGISQSSVSRIFSTWINFLYFELQFLISWPSKEQIRSCLPKSFKYFPRTRAIIDCTELFIQRPSLPSSQRITWSSYKHHNTFKLLVSITPSGSFSFISKLWSGSASDKKITEKSGFLEKIEYGDDVMADRGFLISGSLALRGATLNIPPFSHGKQLSSRATTKTRRIANARIQVERTIGDLKGFKILQGVIPLKLKPYMDQTVFVCGCLCNISKKRVK